MDTVKNVGWVVVPAPVLRSDIFRTYPAGTNVKIGERSFVRTQHSTFWREIDVENGMIFSSTSLEDFENKAKKNHVVLNQEEDLVN